MPPQPSVDRHGAPAAHTGHTTNHSRYQRFYSWHFKIFLHLSIQCAATNLPRPSLLFIQASSILNSRTLQHTGHFTPLYSSSVARYTSHPLFQDPALSGARFSLLFFRGQESSILCSRTLQLLALISLLFSMARHFFLSLVSMAHRSHHGKQHFQSATPILPVATCSLQWWSFQHVHVSHPARTLKFQASEHNMSRICPSFKCSLCTLSRAIFTCRHCIPIAHWLQPVAAAAHVRSSCTLFLAMPHPSA